MNSSKILLVEDDLFIREVFTEALEKKGFTVETAGDGEQALEKLKEGGWDVVLMDNNIPKLSGIEVMKQAKTDGLVPKHVLFLTNTSDQTEIAQLLEFGEGYLVKSDITPQDLIEKVNHLLGV